MLTELRKRLAEEWVIDFNAQKAGERAGMTGDNIRISAWQMLQDVETQDHISELREKQAARTFVTADKVQAEIARLAFSDIRDYYREDGTLKNPHELSDDAAAALAAIEVEENFDKFGNKIGDTTKIKPYDKLNALDKLARRLGMFEKDNDQHVPKEGRRMEVVIVRPKPVDD